MAYLRQYVLLGLDCNSMIHVVSFLRLCECNGLKFRQRAMCPQFRIRCNEYKTYDFTLNAFFPCIQLVKNLLIYARLASGGRILSSWVLRRNPWQSFRRRGQSGRSVLQMSMFAWPLQVRFILLHLYCAYNQWHEGMVLLL